MEILHYITWWLFFVAQQPDSDSRTCAKEVSAEQAANNWLKSAESDVKSSASAHSAFAVCAYLIHLRGTHTAWTRYSTAHCALQYI